MSQPTSSVPRSDLPAPDVLDASASGGSRADAETRVWLQLLALQNGIFGHLNRTLLRETGISLAKFEVLVQLDRYRDGISIGRLSELLKVTSGNVSALARRMLEDDLILKNMSDVDRRSFVVRLSPHGAEVFALATTVHDTCLRDIFVEMSGTMLADVEKMLGLFRETIRIE